MNGQFRSITQSLVVFLRAQRVLEFIFFKNTPAFRPYTPYVISTKLEHDRSGTLFPRGTDVERQYIISYQTNRPNPVRRSSPLKPLNQIDSLFRLAKKHKRVCCAHKSLCHIKSTLSIQLSTLQTLPDPKPPGVRSQIKHLPFQPNDARPGVCRPHH